MIDSKKVKFILVSFTFLFVVAFIYSDSIGFSLFCVFVLALIFTCFNLDDYDAVELGKWQKMEDFKYPRESDFITMNLR